jgi:tRNA pseudouridine38-40 synthase
LFPERKIKLLIAYDGTEYHGWQSQPGYRTVQSVLCEAATSLLRFPTRVVGASRTDAGVHAMGQVGLIKTTNPIVAGHLGLGLNDYLPQDIAVLSAEEVGPGFDLVGDVARKAYRYTIYTGRIRPIRRVRFCWHLPAPLAVEAMHEAGRRLLGMHDFRSFAGSVEEGRSTIRTLFRCDVARGIDGDPDLIAIDVEGDGFLHRMVRIIAGTLINIGRGHWPAEHMPNILAACNRKAAGHLAPACGLCLEWIRYRQEESEV